MKLNSELLTSISWCMWKTLKSKTFTRLHRPVGWTLVHLGNWRLSQCHNKTCSFINLCLHFSAFVYTHTFSLHLTQTLCVCVSADQVYGDQDMHEVVRKHCMDYLVSDCTHTSSVHWQSVYQPWFVSDNNVCFPSRWRTQTISPTMWQRTSPHTSTGRGKTIAMATTLRCRPWLRCTTDQWRCTSTAQVSLSGQ